ncbi:hypothetical protein [Geodermatophilus marinus]|nr:hypothetical protein [Geodermatophilus sp. LHW52908]
MQEMQRDPRVAQDTQADRPADEQAERTTAVARLLANPRRVRRA